MTVDDAVASFERVGLLVQLGPNDHISVAADPYDPPDIVKRQGVTLAYNFGFSVYLIDDTWFLRHAPPSPSLQFPALADAVARGLQIFSEYKRANSQRP
jgi:hypothetical protein